MLDAILFKNLSDAAPCPVLRYLVAAERQQTDATDTRAAMGHRGVKGSICIDKGRQSALMSVELCHFRK